MNKEFPTHSRSTYVEVQSETDSHEPSRQELMEVEGGFCHRCNIFYGSGAEFRPNHDYHPFMD